LGSRVSFILMVRVLSLDSTVGLVLGTGETIRFSCTLSNWINSLKVKVILFALKLADESFGFESINTGASVSFGPPCGAMGLAHPPIIEIIATKKDNNIKGVRKCCCFISMLCMRACKHKLFKASVFLMNL